jgi:hypothetical protein
MKTNVEQTALLLVFGLSVIVLMVIGAAMGKVVP